MITMTKPITVQIIGAPVACTEGVRDSWREVSEWAAQQLNARFGDAVQVEYYDLFDPNSPGLPDHAQLPLVLIDGQILSSGGKLPLPAIRRQIEALIAENDATLPT
jgi:disulfide oxidoreductase YuzD